MKKLCLLLLPIYSFSQTTFVNDTITTESGFKIYKGLEIKIGTGSTSDGDFKFIRRNSTGFGTIMTTTTDNSYNKSQESLRRSWAGHKAEVVKIVERGSKKNGYVYEPLISLSSVRYEIDIDNAIASSEIVVPDEFRPKSKDSAQNISVADELAKLNKLYKDSIITKEEYDAQKKKLLGK